MILSNYAIEKMGFSEYPESDVLEFQFGIVRVFSVQGVNFHPDSSKTISEVVKFGENCTVVVSNSLNEGCRLLTGEDFVDEDEEEWLENRKTRPPFALIYFKEFCTRKLKGGRRKEHEGSIITYDAFPEGKEDIRNWEKESLPNIVTSLVPACCGDDIHPPRNRSSAGWHSSHPERNVSPAVCGDNERCAGSLHKTYSPQSAARRPGAVIDVKQPCRIWNRIEKRDTLILSPFFFSRTQGDNPLG